MLELIIPSAYAQSAGGILGGFDVMSLLPLILIFGAFYLFMIRPQQKKMQAQREMLNAISRGDDVVTAGGILGTIAKVINENEVLVEIADNVLVRVLRGTIAENLSKNPKAALPPKASVQAEPKKSPALQKGTRLKKKPIVRAKKTAPKTK